MSEFVELVRNKFCMLTCVDPGLVRADIITHTLDDDCYIVRLFVDEYFQRAGTVEYPATWLEAFKERYFSPWMLKHWPVKHKQFELGVVFPEFVPIEAGRSVGVAIPRPEP